MPAVQMTDEEIYELCSHSYEDNYIPEGYEIKETHFTDSKGELRIYKELVMSEEYKKKIIEERIVELRMKLIDGTITAEEREELKLLIG